MKIIEPSGRSVKISSRESGLLATPSARVMGR